MAASARAAAAAAAVCRRRSTRALCPVVQTCSPDMAKLVDLEERTERHPQLAGRRFPAVAPHAVAQQLIGAHFLGAGSFCRVWRVDQWSASARNRNQPVVGVGLRGRQG